MGIRYAAQTGFKPSRSIKDNIYWQLPAHWPRTRGTWWMEMRMPQWCQIRTRKSLLYVLIYSHMRNLKIVSIDSSTWSTTVFIQTSLDFTLFTTGLSIRHRPSLIIISCPDLQLAVVLEKHSKYSHSVLIFNHCIFLLYHNTGLSRDLGIWGDSKQFLWRSGIMH